MAVYPLGAPPLTPATEDLSLLNKQGIMQSPYSGTSTILNNYAQWQLQISFPPVLRGSRDEKSMAAWQASLRGSEGSFLYYPVDCGKPLTGMHLFSIGYAETRSLYVAGWTGSQATGLETGDLFSIGNRLYRITEVPASSIGGNTIVTFEPALRADVAAGTAVNFQTPRVEMRSANSEDPAGTNKDADFSYPKPIVAVQVLT